MRYVNTWQDYTLLDTSFGERLERWGDVTLIRPDPQIIWQTKKEHPDWSRAHARYRRAKEGGGRWEYFQKTPERWSISYGSLHFTVSPTGFKHTGLFPEQAVNWDFLKGKIAAAKGEVSVLNLFAYTGGATLACAAAGAKVTHVDASKGMVQWARGNAAFSSISPDRVRWLVDDCQKFVLKEQRRGNHYDIILLDPPSYGRGPGGELWKLEDAIYSLLLEVTQLLSEKPICLLLNAYTTGLSPSVMGYLLGVTVGRRFSGGRICADEIGLPVEETGLILPAGQTAIWEK